MPRAARSRLATAAVLAFAVAFGTAACSDSSSSASSTPTAAAPSVTATKVKHKGVMGKVTAISATSLTIVRKNGTSQTYVLDSTTEFGNKKQPLQPSDIKTGEMVVVVPGGAGTAAIRVTLAKRQTAAPTASPTAS